MEQSSQCVDQRPEFIATILEIVASRNGNTGNECIVSDEAFLAHATPTVIATALTPHGELRRKLMNMVLTELNEGKIVSIQTDFYGKSGILFVEATLISALATGIRPAVIRDALSPEEWEIVLRTRYDVIWDIATHGRWHKDHPTAFKRLLDAIDQLGILSWDEKESAVGVRRIAEPLPREVLVSYFEMMEEVRRSGTPADPETIRGMVGNKILVTSVDPNDAWNIVAVAAQKLGIISEKAQEQTNIIIHPEPSGTPSAFSRTEHPTSPGFPASGTATDEKRPSGGHPNGRTPAGVVVTQNGKKPSDLTSPPTKTADNEESPPNTIRRTPAPPPPPEGAVSAAIAPAPSGGDSDVLTFSLDDAESIGEEDISAASAEDGSLNFSGDPTKVKPPELQQATAGASEPPKVQGGGDSHPRQPPGLPPPAPTSANRPPLPSGTGRRTR